MKIPGWIRLSQRAQFLVQLRIRSRIVKIDNVVALPFELRLDEESQPILITSVSVDDEDLLETVARNLFDGGIQQVPNNAGRQGERARLVPGFINLSVKEIWKDDCILVLGCACGPFANLD